VFRFVVIEVEVGKDGGMQAASNPVFSESFAAAWPIGQSAARQDSRAVVSGAPARAGSTALKGVAPL
jgi:hypothetical protein